MPDEPTLPASDITIRPYAVEDFGPVSELWTRINRELAPPEMKDTFERYITAIIDDELAHIDKRFTARLGSAFWVVVKDDQIVGCFGIERRDASRCELRRMYLDKALRGGGRAAWMLKSAEAAARNFGYDTMILSTAEIQTSAVHFYQKQGYHLVRTEVAETASVKTVGGGLKRFHYEKLL